MFKRLYEDNVIGKVNNEEFRMLSEEYREEQKAIKEKIPQLQKESEKLKSIAVRVEKFISIAKKYTDLQELTPEILRTFISKIVIHERAQKWKKTSEQQIDIYFQYIGSIPKTPIKKAS